MGVSTARSLVLSCIVLVAACEGPTTTEHWPASGPQLAALPLVDSWSPAVSVDLNGVLGINTANLEGDDDVGRLVSRCTMPTACAALTPSATCSTASNASSTVNGALASRAFSVSPS